MDMLTVIKDAYGDRVALSVSEVCALLPVSSSHIYELMDEGRFPEMRLGSKRLVPVDQFCRMMQKGGTQEGPAPQTKASVKKLAGGSSAQWRKDL